MQAATPRHPAGSAGFAPAVAACDFPALDSSVPTARRWLRGRLRVLGLGGGPAEGAELVITELVANAVAHAEGDVVHCRISVEPAGRSLRLEVHDGGGAQGHPRPRDESVHAEHGRGLLLVSAVSDEWGVAPAARGTGRAVWARMRWDGGGAA